MQFKDTYGILQLISKTFELPPKEKDDDDESDFPKAAMRPDHRQNTFVQTFGFLMKSRHA